MNKVIYQKYDNIPSSWTKISEIEEYTIYQDNDLYILTETVNDGYTILRTFKDVSVNIYYGSSNETELSDSNPINGMLPDSKQDQFISLLHSNLEQQILEYTLYNNSKFIKSFIDYHEYTKIRLTEQFITHITKELYGDDHSIKEQNIIKTIFNRIIYIENNIIEIQYNLY